MFDGALIGEGAFIREGCLFQNSQKQEFRFFICILKLSITLLYLKNTEFSMQMNTFKCSEQNGKVVFKDLEQDILCRIGQKQKQLFCRIRGILCNQTCYKNYSKARKEKELTTT